MFTPVTLKQFFTSIRPFARRQCLAFPIQSEANSKGLRGTEVGNKSHDLIAYYRARVSFEVY